MKLLALGIIALVIVWLWSCLKVAEDADDRKDKLFRRKP